MNNKTNILERGPFFLWIGLLVFGTGCKELSEVRKENQVLTDKFSQLRQETEGQVKQYLLKEKPSPVKTASNGVCKEASSHDVAKHISWTLRPVVSNRINLVIYEDGHKEDYPDTQELPDIGEEVQTAELVVQNKKLVKKVVSKCVAKIVTWQERHEKMKDLIEDGVLNPNAPFEHEVQWVY